LLENGLISLCTILNFHLKQLQKNYNIMVVAIEKAEYLGEYKIKFSFSDSVENNRFFRFFKKSQKPNDQKIS